MKLLSFLALFALSIAIVTPEAHAVVNSAQSISVVASSGATTQSVAGLGASAGTIKSSAFRTMIQSTSKALKGIWVYNSTPVTLQIAVGPSGSESIQVFAAPGTLPGGAYNGSPLGAYAAGRGEFYPLSVSQGTKISVEALESDAAQGQVIVTEFFY